MNRSNEITNEQYGLKHAIAIRIASHLVSQLRLIGVVTNEHLGNFLFDSLSDAFMRAPDSIITQHIEDIQKQLLEGTELYGNSNQSLGTQEEEGTGTDGLLYSPEFDSDEELRYSGPIPDGNGE